MVNILFVCRYNRFRSKIAEAYFNDHSKKGLAKSTGFFPGISLSKGIMDCAKNLNLKLTNTTQGINHQLIIWSDEIIIIDNADCLQLFDDYIRNDKKKVIHWNIPDVKGDSLSERMIVAKKIIKKVQTELLKSSI